MVLVSSPHDAVELVDEADELDELEELQEEAEEQMELVEEALDDEVLRSRHWLMQEASAACGSLVATCVAAS